MSRLRDTAAAVLRGAGWVALTIVALAVAVAVVLFTPPGEAALSELLVACAESRIDGEVEIADLDVRGDEIVLEGVVVRTPAGERVFTAEHVLADLDLGGILHAQLSLQRLVVTDYAVRLRRQGEGDWSVAAALAGFEPRDVSRLRAIQGLRMRGGVVDARARVRGDTRSFRIEDLEVSGDLAFPTDLVVGDVELDGRIVAPQKAGLTVQLQARGEDAAQRVDVRAAIADAEIDAWLQLPAKDDSGETRLSEVSGRLVADIPAFPLAGFTYGPISVAVGVERGRVHVRDARVVFPGSTLTVEADEEGDVVGAVVIESLGRTTRALEPLLATELPALSGRGRLTARLDDPIRSATASLEVELPRLQLGDRQAMDLRLEGAFADVGRLRHGAVTLSAGELQLGDRRFGDVTIDVARRGDHVSAHAGIAAPHPIELGLAGELLVTPRAIRIDQLLVSYPDASWALARDPATVRLSDGGVVVEPFALVSDGERIMGELEWTDTRHRARLDLADVRIDSLPAPLLPSELSLGGELTGELTLEGGRDDRRATADIRLAEGRIEGVKGVSARVDARYSGGRIRGDFEATAASAWATGRFDLPASLPPEKGARVEGHVRVRGLQLADAWRIADDYIPADVRARVSDPAGHLSLRSSVDGQWPEVEATGTLELREGSVVVDGIGRYHDVGVLMEATQERLVLHALTAHARGGTLRVAGRARRLGDALRFRYRLGVVAERFPIPLEDPVSATLDAELHGVVSRERLTSEAKLDGVRVYRRLADP